MVRLLLINENDPIQAHSVIDDMGAGKVRKLGYVWRNSRGWWADPQGEQLIRGPFQSKDQAAYALKNMGSELYREGRL
jgi:hypothetical protein